MRESERESESEVEKASESNRQTEGQRERRKREKVHTATIRQAGLCAALAVICLFKTPVSSYQGVPVHNVSQEHNGGVVWLGWRGTHATAETQEDGPWNASRQLLLLTSGNMRAGVGDLEF